MIYMIVGASAGLGRALAYSFAAAGHDLVVVSSDERDIHAIASDLRIRYDIRVVPVVTDLGKNNTYIKQLETAIGSVAILDGLLFPVGSVFAGDDEYPNWKHADRNVRVNFLSIVEIILRFMPTLQKRPRGVIVGFGSVAATRGRRANVLYSASKRALESFFESLRHASVGTSVIVQFYKLGYLDTIQAFGKRTYLPKANPVCLGERVLHDLHRDIGVAYYPSYWRAICTIINLIPWFLFKRLKF